MEQGHQPSWYFTGVAGPRTTSRAAHAVGRLNRCFKHPAIRQALEMGLLAGKARHKRISQSDVSLRAHGICGICGICGH